MPDPTALPQLNQLPPEVLHGIFYHLDIPDILRIRRASRYLNEISHSRDVWTKAYHKAEFVRPPGPFLWQSPIDLEKVLVSSFRVDQYLRHGDVDAQGGRPMRKLREIQYAGMRVRPRLVFSRFLILAFGEEVHCYDLNLDVSDSDPGASIIYRSSGGTISSFHCVSAIDLEGRPFACMVLVESVNTMKQISTYLLNVGEASAMTLDLLHRCEHSEFDIEAIDLGPRMIVIQSQVGVYLGTTHWEWHVISIDVHARTEFLLPPLTREAWAHKVQLSGFSIDNAQYSLTSISTSTHLLLALRFDTVTVGWNTFIQAFALPPLDTHFRSTHSCIPLSLSHSGVIPGIHISRTPLLHDSAIDPTTQDVLISIRAWTKDPSCPANSLAKYGVLHLSTVHTSHGHGTEACTVALQLLGSLSSLSRVLLRDRSLDGIGRVLYPLRKCDHLPISVVEYDVRAGSSNDSDQEIRTVEYLSIFQFPAQCFLADYDPYSCRICLRSTVVEVYDLAL